MRKKIYLSIGIVVIFILGLVTGYVYCEHIVAKESEENTIYLAYGDNLNKAEVNDYQKEKVSLKAKKDEYLLVLYLEKGCGSCYRQLEIVERLSRIFENQVSVAVLWKGDIPKEDYKSLRIDSNQLYSIKEKLALNGTPAALILDEEGKIIFLTSDMDKIVDKTLTLENIDDQQVRKNANTYLTQIVNADKSKIPIIYFSMKGCKDCEAADEVIDEEVLRKYDIQYLFNEDAYGEEKFIDIDSIFLNIYEIDWYPSFLILNKDEAEDDLVIGNTEINVLKDTLMQSK